jgi:hypothetical protein
MSRNRKLVVALLALALVAAAGLSAQAASANADAKIFCIDIGMATGYNLNASGTDVGRTFGFNLTVSDNFVVGVANTTVVPDGAAALSYNFLRLGYYLTPVLGFNLYVGNRGANLATGAGAFYNLFKTKSETAFANALKIRLEYLFDGGAGVGKGDIVLAVATSLGY